MVAVKTYANARRNSLRRWPEALIATEMYRRVLGHPTSFAYLEWGTR